MGRGLRWCCATISKPSPFVPGLAVTVPAPPRRNPAQRVVLVRADARIGERRGIARYGFVLPMDEANATVSIDLSGRPYPLFEGTFETPFIGDYRTDLTAHVFRSLAEAMGAAVHVSVTGDDDLFDPRLRILQPRLALRAQRFTLRVKANGFIQRSFPGFKARDNVFQPFQGLFKAQGRKVGAGHLARVSKPLDKPPHRVDWI